MASARDFIDHHELDLRDPPAGTLGGRVRDADAHNQTHSGEKAIIASLLEHKAYLNAEVEALRQVVRLLRVRTGVRPRGGVAQWCVWVPTAWLESATREQVQVVQRALEATE